MDEQGTEFNFEAWRELAERDPAAFEAARAAEVARLIERAPQHLRQRLRGLQWRIDQTRACAPSPVAACVRISSLMWDAVLGEGGLVERLEALGAPGMEPAGPVREARVLAFRRAPEAGD